ncbi:MAG: type II secretion system F family protein [Lentisphaerae bacterium]|jgi:type IV pilus assembly protein PilC|nr:type II secretion system F family protein [Lentisphaerota bacterium]
MAKRTFKVSGVSKIRKRELIPFTRQASSMLNAGMSIIATIATLEEQCQNLAFKQVLRQLRDVIESGSPFSEGLALFPQIFDDLYVNMVAAGEESGQFAAVLRRLADMLDSSARLTRKVKSALTYPVIILSISVLIAVGLITFVVPIFSEMFSAFGQELPFLTKMLMVASDFMIEWWYIVIGVIIVAAAIFKKWHSTEMGKYEVDRATLKLPVFGDLLQKVSVARFCRLFSHMLTSGVPILNALEIVGKSIGNKALEKSFLSARSGVEQGDTLSNSLAGKPFLPIIMVRMIAAGEKSGRIDEMLISVANTYDDEIEATLETLTSLMEPFLIVFMGAIIGTIVIAMYLPIFQLGSIVG